jgi:hypothetical protein
MYGGGEDGFAGVCELEAIRMSRIDFLSWRLNNYLNLIARVTFNYASPLRWPSRQQSTLNGCDKMAVERSDPTRLDPTVFGRKRFAG